MFFSPVYIGQKDLVSARGQSFDPSFGCQTPEPPPDTRPRLACNCQGPFLSSPDMSDLLWQRWWSEATFLQKEKKNWIGAYHILYHVITSYPIRSVIQLYLTNQVHHWKPRWESTMDCRRVCTWLRAGQRHRRHHHHHHHQHHNWQPSRLQAGQHHHHHHLADHYAVLLFKVPTQRQQGQVKKKHEVNRVCCEIITKSNFSILLFESSTVLA